jgi:hypothetical protein
MGHLAQSAEAQTLFLLWFLTCAVCNLLLGLALPHLTMQTELIIGAAMGYIGAQAAVHAIWSVLGPWNRWIRPLLSALTALILFLLFWVGIAVEEFGRSSFWEATWSFLCCLPLFLLATQLPLWFFRMWLRCRFVFRSDTESTSATRPLSLRDLMLATVVVAMVFAAARLAKPEEVDSVAEFLLPVLLGAAVAGVISLCTTVPTVFATHLARNTVVAVTVAVGIEAVFFVSLIAIASLIEGTSPPSDAFFYLTVVFVSYSVFLTGPILLSRLLGYRLVWGRQTESKRLGDVRAVGRDGGKETADDGQKNQAGDQERLDHLDIPEVNCDARLGFDKGTGQMVQDVGQKPAE